MRSFISFFTHLLFVSVIIAGLLLPLCSCRMMKDMEVRGSLDNLKTDLKDFDESIDTRFAALSEEIRITRDKFAEFKGVETEKSFIIEKLEERINTLDKEIRDRLTAISLNQTNTIEILEVKEKHLQEQIESIRKRIEEFNLFKQTAEKDHNAISVLDAKLNIIVEEVTKSNQELKTEIAQYRAYVEEVKNLLENLNKKVSDIRYTVQNGDTLSIIAERYKVPVDSIIKANNIQDVYKLQIGQELLIPGTE